MHSFFKKIIFITIAIGTVISGIFIVRAVNNRGDSPYIYLKMDEGQGTTTYDASGNANTGTLNGGATWKNEEECVAGKCLYFDGTGDYVSIPDFALE